MAIRRATPKAAKITDTSLRADTPLRADTHLEDALPNNRLSLDTLPLLASGQYGNSDLQALSGKYYAELLASFIQEYSSFSAGRSSIDPGSHFSRLEQAIQEHAGLLAKQAILENSSGQPGALAADPFSLSASYQSTPCAARLSNPTKRGAMLRPRIQLKQSDGTKASGSDVVVSDPSAGIYLKKGKDGSAPRIANEAKAYAQLCADPDSKEYLASDCLFQDGEIIALTAFSGITNDELIRQAERLGGIWQQELSAHISSAQPWQDPVPDLSSYLSSDQSPSSDLSHSSDPSYTEASRFILRSSLLGMLRVRGYLSSRNMEGLSTETLDMGAKFASSMRIMADYFGIGSGAGLEEACRNFLRYARPPADYLDVFPKNTMLDIGSLSEKLESHGLLSGGSHPITGYAQLAELVKDNLGDPERLGIIQYCIASSTKGFDFEKSGIQAPAPLNPSEIALTCKSGSFDGGLDYIERLFGAITLCDAFYKARCPSSEGQSAKVKGFERDEAAFLADLESYLKAGQHTGMRAEIARKHGLDSVGFYDPQDSNRYSFVSSVIYVADIISGAKNPSFPLTEEDRTDIMENTRNMAYAYANLLNTGCFSSDLADTLPIKDLVERISSLNGYTPVIGGIAHGEDNLRHWVYGTLQSLTIIHSSAGADSHYLDAASGYLKILGSAARTDEQKDTLGKAIGFLLLQEGMSGLEKAWGDFSAGGQPSSEFAGYAPSVIMPPLKSMYESLSNDFSLQIPLVDLSDILKAYAISAQNPYNNNMTFPNSHSYFMMGYTPDLEISGKILSAFSPESLRDSVQ